MPYKFVQGFERGYKHKGAWDARPQSSINVLIEEPLRSPHSLEGECVEYVTISCYLMSGKLTIILVGAGSPTIYNLN